MIKFFYVVISERMAEINKFESDLEDFETEKEKADRLAGVYIMKIIFYFPKH